MSILIDRFDHVVINCSDVEKTAEWYRTVLENFGVDNRFALKFGRQKLNLRPIGAQNWETGRTEAAGSEDLCFVTETSIYCRDPDGNLIEVASYPDA